MPRLYVNSRGRAGVSVGPLGCLVLPFMYVMYAALIAAGAAAALALIAAPFVIVGVIGVLWHMGDIVLMAIPPYRRRRRRVGPITWPSRALRWLGDALRRSARRPRQVKPQTAKPVGTPSVTAPAPAVPTTDQVVAEVMRLLTGAGWSAVQRTGTNQFLCVDPMGRQAVVVCDDTARDSTVPDNLVGVVAGLRGASDEAGVKRMLFVSEGGYSPAASASAAAVGLELVNVDAVRKMATALSPSVPPSEKLPD